MFKMIALLTFKGLEGFIKEGQVFEVDNKSRAEELEQHKLAAYYEEEGIELEEILKNLNSHAKVDEFAAANNITIPAKDEAKLDERKAAIVEALENAAK